MKIAVTGAHGQLGAELCRMLGPAAAPLDVDTLDLTKRAAVNDAFLAMRPDLVINCAAYTQVDAAESEPLQCRAVNATAVEHLAAVCSQLDCPLVQISTDYVFSGSIDRCRPWREDEPTSARGVYAETKREGELAAAAWKKHLIVRTCGLYARPSHIEARNFVKTILRLSQTRPTLRVVDDQRCTPSYVPHVARAVLFLSGADGGGPAPWGTYHVTNEGAATWFEFAGEIVRLAGRNVALEAITTAEYGSAAPRPAYSVLDTSAYRRLGGPPLGDWRSALAEYFAEL